MNYNRSLAVVVGLCRRLSTATQQNSFTSLSSIYSRLPGFPQVYQNRSLHTSIPLSSAESIFQKKEDASTYPANFHKIDSYEQFTNFVSPLTNSEHAHMGSKLIATLYTSKISTPSKQIFASFVKMAESNPQTIFLSVDVDECPRAAYFADINAVPSVLICYQEDAYRKLIEPEQMAYYTNIINDSQSAIDLFNNTPDKKVFRAKHSWYTHNIGIDNLNINKVGWPSS